MTGTETLQALIEQYDARRKKAAQEAPAFAGAFGMGAGDPRLDPCHKQFYDDTEQWARDLAAAAPASAEAAQALHTLLLAADTHRDTDGYMMYCAAAKHALVLIPLLDAGDAARLQQELEDHCPRPDRTPVQQQVLDALAQRSGSVGPGKNWGIWVRRVIALLVGLTIAHLGVTLFLLADLGSDPFNVMIQGLHRTQSFGLTHGTVHAAISFLIILVLLVVDRSYVRIGTFLCMVLGGPIIDVFTLVLGSLVSSTSPLPVRILAVTLGCGILAFGMTIVIRSDAGTGPNDLVAVVLSDKLKRKFGIVRIVVDVCFALTGFLLGGSLGLGTVICVAVVGPVAQVFMPVSEKLCRRFIGE